MSALTVEHYVRRAADFANGMKLLNNESEYRSSAALLAIHSAISYSDALRVALGEMSLSADNHLAAAEALQLKLSNERGDVDGLKHLRKLLSRKNLVEYQNTGISLTEANDLVTAAIRFEVWANRIGRDMKLRGWAHGDQ